MEIRLTGRQARLVRLLQDSHRGKGSAVPHKALAHHLDMSPRNLRKEVEKLRRDHGLPILSSYKNGYFLAENSVEEHGFSYIRPSNQSHIANLH